MICFIPIFTNEYSLQSYFEAPEQASRMRSLTLTFVSVNILSLALSDKKLNFPVV